MIPHPKSMGPLTLDRKIGVDGVAETWRGTWLGEARHPVLIRRLQDWIVRDHDVLSAVEARIADLIELRHPRLVRLLDYVRLEDERYVVEEDVPGTDLMSLVRRVHEQGHSIPPNVFLHFAVQLCTCLEALHNNRGGNTGDEAVLHRALRPETAHVTLEGAVRLGGYGLLTSLNLIPANKLGDPVPGRMAFLSPEQVDDGREISRATDIFSLGSLLYTVLSGEVLFDAPSDLQTIWAIRDCDVEKKIAATRRYVPGIERVLVRCLEAKPGRRYQTVATLREDLRGLLDLHDKTRVLDSVLELLASAGVAPPALTPMTDTETAYINSDPELDDENDEPTANTANSTLLPLPSDEDEHTITDPSAFRGVAATALLGGFDFASSMLGATQEEDAQEMTEVEVVPIDPAGDGATDHHFVDSSYIPDPPRRAQLYPDSSIFLTNEREITASIRTPRLQDMRADGSDDTDRPVPMWRTRLGTEPPPPPMPDLPNTPLTDPSDAGRGSAPSGGSDPGTLPPSELDPEGEELPNLLVLGLAGALFLVAFVGWILLRSVVNPALPPDKDPGAVASTYKPTKPDPAMAHPSVPVAMVASPALAANALEEVTPPAVQLPAPPPEPSRPAAVMVEVNAPPPVVRSPPVAPTPALGKANSGTALIAVTPPAPNPPIPPTEPDWQPPARVLDSSVGARAARGSLTQDDRTFLESLDQVHPDYTRARVWLYDDATARGVLAERKRQIDAVMKLPENTYNPVYLTEAAQVAIAYKDWDTALARARKAEQHWGRLPSEAVFTRKAMIYEEQASAWYGLFVRSDGQSTDALNESIRAWQRYRQHVATRDLSLAARADERIASLTDILQRASQ